MDYLVQVAKAAPDAVTDVALGLVKSESAWVRRGIVSIAASVPAVNAAPLAKAILGWKSQGIGWRTDPQELSQVAIHLLQGGFNSLGLKIAEKLFRPRRRDGSRRSVRADFALDDYWYDELLPPVVAALGDMRLKVLAQWLEDYEVHAERVAKTADLDLSHIHRPSIESRGQYNLDIEEALIDAVRDASIDAMKIDPTNAVEILRYSGQTLSRRICVYATAVALRDSPEDQALRAVAIDMAGWPELGRPGFLIEFSLLIQAAVASTGSTAIFDRILPTLASGPMGSPEELAERLKRPDQSADELDSEIASYVEHWRHRILSGIGAPALPPTLRDELVALDEKRGGVPRPEREFEVVTWSGPESPLDSEALDAMTRDELLNYLETWHPDPDTWRGPSYEGLGRELAGAITRRPDLLLGKADRVVELRPTYLRSILGGWREAIRSGASVPWLEVARIVATTVGEPIESPIPVEEGRSERDEAHRDARDAALWLAVALIERTDDRVAAPREAVELVAPVLIALATDERIREGYASSGPAGMDPLTLSLNQALPVAVRGLTLLAGSEDLASDAEVMAVLADLAAWEDPHGAVASVLGEATSRLYVRQRTWLEAHAAEIFGTAEGLSRQQQIAFTTALATNHAHAQLLGLLRGGIEWSLTSGTELAVGWRGMRTPGQLIGDWITTMYLRSSIDRDHPLLDLFFEKSPLETRAEVLGHIGWSFMHAKLVDPEPLARAMRLWDERVEHVRRHPEEVGELADFYWWARSEKFPLEWWLSRLRAATELHPNLRTRGMLGERLAQAARTFPGLVLAIVRNIINAREDPEDFRNYDLMERAIPPTIAAALDSGDAEVADDARKLMNELGRSGFIDLEGRVNDLRKPDA
ncbi:hypothetical protein [Yonghaparkia sp. Root332]|uniref:hypothetical protein n=1 Tax=Yonghaparkia sp. Root332 TaxID=1736516 RepID=UPI0012E3D90F|nr:hypothetical protein [Yonghaparkia sp. Root332]